MHAILHGIRRVLSVACGGSCLPIISLLIDGSKEDEAEFNLRQKGDNEDLQPTIKGHDEDYGVLPPQRGDAAVNNDLHDGDLLPQLNGEDDAVNNDLQTTMDGRNSKQDEGSLSPRTRGGDEAGNFNLQPESKGQEDDDGVLQPQIGVLSNGDILPSLVDYLHVDALHAWKHILFTHMHAAIRGLDKASVVYDYPVIDFAKPRVNPKVKKKTSLLLCLTIQTPFHPGEYGHDGSTPSPHHAPYYFPFSLYTEISYPSSPYPYLKASLSSAICLQENLSNEGIRSLLLPLLGGSNRRQDWQKQSEDKEQMKLNARPKTKSNAESKMKTKKCIMEMCMFYLMKDVLDPG